MPAAGRDDRGAQAAARALAEHYGMTCELDAVPGELDRNFACDSHVGSAFWGFELDDGGRQRG